MTVTVWIQNSTIAINFIRFTSSTSLVSSAITRYTATISIKPTFRSVANWWYPRDFPQVISLNLLVFLLATTATTTIGGPAQSLWLFKTQRHAYIFSGTVHLGDYKLLLKKIEKNDILVPKKSAKNTNFTKLALFTSVFRNWGRLASVRPP